MAEFNKAQPLSPLELMQLRLRIIRAMARVHGKPEAQSQALADMLALVATVDSLDERLKAAEAERAELENWQNVAVEANKALDAYLRTKEPDLPEHYGMPVDGVRIVIEGLEIERDGLERERDAYRSRAEQLERERDSATGYARMRLAEDIEAARKVDDA